MVVLPIVQQSKSLSEFANQEVGFANGLGF